MDAARIALKQLGFSEFEATNAVSGMSPEDPKDVTPPWSMAFPVGSLPVWKNGNSCFVEIVLFFSIIVCKFVL